MRNISLLTFCALAATCFAATLGPFDDESGVAETMKTGHTEFNSMTREYSITGAGGAIGGTSDGFHFVWKQVAGDVTIDADARYSVAYAGDHKKAAVMIRQSLGPGSAFVGAVLQDNGLAALQYRADAGAVSRSTDVIASADLTSPVHLSLSRVGDRFTVSAGRRGKMGGPLPSAPPVTVTMNGPVYVGLAVASGDPAAQASATFSNVNVNAAAAR